MLASLRGTGVTYDELGKVERSGATGGSSEEGETDDEVRRRRARAARRTVRVSLRLSFLSMSTQTQLRDMFAAARGGEDTVTLGRKKGNVRSSCRPSQRPSHNGCLARSPCPTSYPLISSSWLQQ